jgi:epsin
MTRERIRESMVKQTRNMLIIVRSRAKEIADLLSDSEKVRAERKKAKQAKSKYTGVGSDDGGFGGTGKKYGGFGSDDLQYGAYSGQVYGNHYTVRLIN